MTDMEQLPDILKIHKDNIGEVQFSSRVAGTTFHPPAQEVLRVLKRVNPNQIILRFEPEPTNEVDPYAVAIYVTIQGATREQKLGYFPQSGSQLISYVLTHTDEYNLIISNIHIAGGTEDKEMLGLFYDFRIIKL